MFTEMKALVSEMVEERFNLEGDCWVVLDELGKICQDDLHTDDQLRYRLYDDADGDTFYVKPGVSGIFMVTTCEYNVRVYGNFSKTQVRETPSKALLELCRLSEK